MAAVCARASKTRAMSHQCMIGTLTLTFGTFKASKTARPEDWARRSERGKPMDYTFAGAVPAINCSAASLSRSKCTGRSKARSTHEVSSGTSPVHIRIGVRGERSLIMWAISTPLIPGMRLSVITKSWTLASNTVRASSALRAHSTTKPKLPRNHLVVRRLSSRSSTTRMVFNLGLGSLATGCQHFECAVESDELMVLQTKGPNPNI